MSNGQPCMYCGKPVVWVQERGLWFCESCNQYMPAGRAPSKTNQEINDIFGRIGDELGSRPTYFCQTCRARLEFVHQYGKWFCAQCNTYA